MLILQVSLLPFLVDFAPRDCKVFLIDPEPIHLSIPKYEHIQKPATEGMSDILDLILHN